MLLQQQGVNTSCFMLLKVRGGGCVVVLSPEGSPSPSAILNILLITDGG